MCLPFGLINFKSNSNIMQLKQLLIEELKRESENTRKILKLVPEGKNDWRPHEKSFPIGRLAAHVAELPMWLDRALNHPEYDMAAHPLKSITFDTNKELIDFFEEKLKNGISILERITDEQLEEPWVFRRGDHIISKDTRYNTIRSWMFNHQVHHRAQLSVYLRLLDIPVPGMYGPSADDRIAQQAAAAQKA